MFDLPKVFREIHPESTQTDKWKEFVFNSGEYPTSFHYVSIEEYAD